MAKNSEFLSRRLELIRSELDTQVGKAASEGGLLNGQEVTVAMRGSALNAKISVKLRLAIEAYAMTLDGDKAAKIACYGSVAELEKDLSRSPDAIAYLNDLVRQKLDAAGITEATINTGLMDVANAALKAGTFTAAHACWRTLAEIRGMRGAKSTERLTPSGATPFGNMKPGPADEQVG